MTADRLAAVILFLMGLLYGRLSLMYRGATVADVVGPSAYPLILGILLSLLAVALFLESRRPAAEGGTFWMRHGRTAVMVGALFAYTMLLERLGFLVTTFSYLTLSHLWFGERSALKAAVVAAAVTIGLWLVFDRVLSLRLPAGVLGLLP
jgi:putative tricarboxylic transport membrane protein